MSGVVSGVEAKLDETGGPTGNRPIGFLRLLAVLVGTALLGSVSLIYPFGRDHGIYGFIAQSAREGMVMYRDILMGTPPFTVLLHMLATAVFGGSMTAIRILDLLWTMATAGLLYFFTRKAFDRRWLAVTAGLMYSFFYYLFGYWDTAQVDGFLNLPVVAAFAVVLPAVLDPGAKNRLRWLWTGILLGIAFWFKYPIAILLPGLAGFAVYARVRRPMTSLSKASGGSGKWRSEWRAAIADIALLVTGFAVPVVIVLAVLAASGALDAFLEPVRLRALAYPSLSFLDENLFGRIGRFLNAYLSNPDYSVGLILGAVGLIATIAAFLELRLSEDRRKLGLKFIGDRQVPIAFVWMWFALALVYVFLQGRFFPYHMLPLLPVLAILSVFALARLPKPLLDRPLKNNGRFALVVGLCLGVLTTTSYPAKFANLLLVVAGRVSLGDYWRGRRHSTEDFFLAEQIVLADYLRDRTRPGDHVLVWGLDPLVNLLADRNPGTRFIYHQQLTSVLPWPGLREAFMTEVKSGPPEVLVVAHRDALPIVVLGHSRSSFQSLMLFEEFRGFILSEYEYETRIGRFDVLRRTVSERVLPDVGLEEQELRFKLKEALYEIEQLDPTSYRTILWPWHPDSARAVLQPELHDRVVSYQGLFRLTWPRGRTFDSFLPCLSIWVFGDNRPFAEWVPFGLQGKGTSFEVYDLKFTLLGSSPGKTILVYLIELDP